MYTDDRYSRVGSLPQGDSDISMMVVEEAVASVVLPSVVRLLSAALRLDDRVRMATIIRSASRLLTLVATCSVKTASSASRTRGTSYALQATDCGAIPVLIDVLKNIKVIVS